MAAKKLNSKVSADFKVLLLERRDYLKGRYEEMKFRNSRARIAQRQRDHVFGQLMEIQEILALAAEE